jgi:hypothetical protein
LLFLCEIFTGMITYGLGVLMCIVQGDMETFSGSGSFQSMIQDYASANGLTERTVDYLVGEGMPAYEDQLMSIIHSCITDIRSYTTSVRQEWLQEQHVPMSYWVLVQELADQETLLSRKPYLELLPIWYSMITSLTFPAMKREW